MEKRNEPTAQEAAVAHLAKLRAEIAWTRGRATTGPVERRTDALRTLSILNAEMDDVERRLAAMAAK